ncbi:hypothetical protein HK405_006413, partial [Cladochytrium tenue]
MAPVLTSSALDDSTASPLAQPPLLAQVEDVPAGPVASSTGTYGEGSAAAEAWIPSAALQAILAGLPDAYLAAMREDDEVDCGASCGDSGSDSRNWEQDDVLTDPLLDFAKSWTR